MKKLYLTTLIVLFCTSISFCQGGNVFQPFIYVDQDLFFPKHNQDRNYTMGLALGATFSQARFLNPWGLIVSFNSAHTSHHSITLGYGAFTPFDLGSTAPVTDDRPYGGILSLRASSLTYFSSSDLAFSRAFALGILGTGIGDWFQSMVHEARIKKGISNRVIPQGWDNQISDGGELTGMVSLELRKLFSTRAARPFGVTRAMDQWEVFGTGELNLGYYSNVQAGLTTRIGDLSVPFYAFSSSPTTFINQNLSGTASTGLPKIFFFASARQQLVFYNALLQGQFKDSPHTLSSKEKSNFVFAYDFGLNIRFPIGLSTQLQWTSRAPEYRIQTSPGIFEEGRWHYWGSIYLSWTFG